MGMGTIQTAGSKNQSPTGTCQSGQSSSICAQTSDCVPIAGMTPPHAVCRESRCQRGVTGDYCGQDEDCLFGFCRPTGKCGGNSYNRKKKNKTKTKKNTNRHPPSSFVFSSTTYIIVIVSQQRRNKHIHTPLFRLNNTVTTNSYKVTTHSLL